MSSDTDRPIQFVDSIPELMHTKPMTAEERDDLLLVIENIKELARDCPLKLSKAPPTFHVRRNFFGSAAPSQENRPRDGVVYLTPPEGASWDELKVFTRKAREHAMENDCVVMLSAQKEGARGGEG